MRETSYLYSCDNLRNDTGLLETMVITWLPNGGLFASRDLRESTQQDWLDRGLGQILLPSTAKAQGTDNIFLARMRTFAKC